MADFGTHFQDDAAALMAEQVGQETVRAFDAVNFPELRPANAADVDLDKDLSVAQRRNLHLVEHEGMLLFNQNGGGGFQNLI